MNEVATFAPCRLRSKGILIVRLRFADIRTSRNSCVDLADARGLAAALGGGGAVQSVDSAPQSRAGSKVGVKLRSWRAAAQSGTRVSVRRGLLTGGAQLSTAPQ